MKIIPTLLRKFVAYLPFSTERQLAKVGANSKHIEVFNEAYNQFYKNNWDVQDLLEKEKRFISLQTSPEQLKACNEVLVYFHEKEILTMHLIDVLVSLISLKTTPEQISLSKKGLVTSVDKSFFHQKQLVVESQKNFIDLIKENPTNDQCKLFDLIFSQKNERGFSNVSDLLCELLKEKPNDKEWALYKDVIDYHLNQEADIYKATSIFTLLLQIGKSSTQRESCAKAINVYKEHKLEIDSSILILVNLLENNAFTKELNIFMLGINQCKISNIDNFPFAKSFKDLISAKPSEDVLRLLEEGIKTCSSSTNLTTYMNSLIGLEPSLEEFAVYKKYCTSLIKENMSIQGLTKGFVQLLKQNSGTLEIESSFKSYLDLVTFMKSNYNDTFQIDDVIDIVLANPDEELLDMYKKTLSIYSTIKNIKTPLAENFTELIKAKPSKEQRKLFNLALETHKNAPKFVELLISDSGTLINAHKVYELKADKLIKLSPEIRTALEKEWLNTFTKTDKLMPGDIALSLPLNYAMIKLCDAIPTESPLWEIYNVLALSERTNETTFIRITNDFTNLANSRPSKEFLDLCKDAISYYKENNFFLSPLRYALSSLAYTRPTKEKINGYLEGINSLKEKKLLIHSLIDGFARIAPYKPGDDFLREFSKIHSSLQGDEPKTFNDCVALWIENDASIEHFKILGELYKLCLDKRWNLHSNQRLNIEFLYALKYPVQLLRNCKNQIQNGNIQSEADALHLFKEIRLHSTIYKILKKQGDLNKAKSILNDVGTIDSVPFSIRKSQNGIDNDYKYQAYNPQAIKTQMETERTFLRLFDLNYGFSALTFDCKRTPEKEPPLLAQFGNDVGKVSYINAKDISLFPGRGFEISDFNLNKIFVSDKENKSDPFHLYKTAWPWSKDIFNDFTKTRFIFTRGFVAAINKDKKYTLDGTSYSYFVVNNHHHNKGCDVAYLVPTAILEKKLEKTQIPYKDYLGYSKEYKDINEAGLTIEDLIESSKKQGLQVLNLGWGSNFSGGLCNAYPLDSKPYFLWEKDLRDNHTTDFWGRVHKSHMRGHYEINMSKELDKKLRPLRKAHDNVYQITNNYQNLFDLFRLSMALWRKGLTVGERVIESIDDELSQSFEPQNLESSSEESDSELDSDFDTNSSVYAQNPNLFRMLSEAYKWHEGRKQGINDKNYFPILVITDTLDYWTQPESPIMLDTYDMIVHEKDKAIPLSDEEIGDIEKGLWTKLFLPKVLDSSKDLRFYDRRDLNIT